MKQSRRHAAPPAPQPISTGPGYAKALRDSITPRLRLAGDRLWEVDALRGVAVVMMVVYHFIWDLQGLGDANIDVQHGFWHYWQITTASLFIGLSGLSQVVRYQRQLQVGKPAYGPFLWHGLAVLTWGLVVGLVTYLFDPRHYIQWGILHLIGFSMVVAHPLLRHRWLSGLLGLALIGLGELAPWLGFSSPWLGWLGLSTTQRPAFDYFPVVPWLGVAFLGVFVGNLVYAGKPSRSTGSRFGGAFPARTLRLLGQNSLLIYLLHQPVMIALLAGFGVISL